MRTPTGCKLFGAQQALGGIQDGLILFHSVVGCNFGSMSLHIPCDMRDIRQTCTIINDTDIIFSGEESLKRAIQNALELFHPAALFVVSGCVSEMIGDDIDAVVSEFTGSTPVIHVEAAGFKGDVLKGYQAACRVLSQFMRKPDSHKKNAVNLLGVGSDDYRLQTDLQGLRQFLGEDVSVQTVLSSCTWQEFQDAPQAELNLVLDPRAQELAEFMERQFGIPFEVIPYPYGIVGIKDLCRVLTAHFGTDFSEKLNAAEKSAADTASRVYPYLQALYGMPAAVIGAGGHADGMRRFLEQELGMEIVCFSRREELADQEDFYDAARTSEAALLFGSSFEMDLADELGIPLIRYDYPVFDEISLTNQPFAGAEGTVCLLEAILNKALQTPALKGALYQ